MTITVISKHLPMAGRFFRSSAGPRVLNLIHLVESARYHLSRFEELASAIGQAPDDFESGLEIRKLELDHYYRFMASFFELESFFFAVKRFLDHAWCCIGEPFGEGAEKIRTLPQAIYQMKKFVKNPNHREIIKGTKFYKALDSSYKNWGEKAVMVRNYVEHVAPLGGLANSYQITVTNGKQILDPFLPDTIPDRTQNISKEKLTYNNKESFTSYVQLTMIKLDELMHTLLNIEELLLFKKT